MKFFLIAGVLLLGIQLLSAAEEQTEEIAVLEARAAGGEPEAMVALGRALFISANSSENIPRLVELMQKAAAAGSPEALDWLGYLALEGKGLPQDERAALEYFRKSAEAGYPKGQLHYGLLLRQGKTIELDNDESLKWIEKAAKQGLVEANAALGRLLFSGDRLQRRDPLRSYEFLKVAAEGGDPACQNAMGVICRRGVGTPNRFRDPAQAEVWFRKAAEQGYAKAQANLAMDLGLGPQSPRRREALMWLLAAKKQNEILAVRAYEELQHTFSPEELAQAEEDFTTRSVRQMILEAARDGRSELKIEE